MKRYIKNILTLCSTFIIANFTLNYNTFAQSDLLGYENNNQLLGVSSSFSVFLEEDFAANGADCEGRIAVGGGANLGFAGDYSVGNNNTNGADVIVGEGPLMNFTTGERTFVVQNPEAEILIDAEVIQTKLIDFQQEFDFLKQISLNLVKDATGSYEINQYWTAEKIFISNELEYNYFTLSAAEITTQECHLNFQVPENSFVIINILDTNVNLYTQLYDCQISEQRISSNNDENNCRILWNLPYAETVTLNGIGRFHGSILAPNADVIGPDLEGAHLSGQLIAKSYNGAMQFGSLSFMGQNDLEEITTETTTETTTKTTTETTITEMTTTTTITTTTATTEATTEITTTEITTTETTTAETTTAETTIETTTTTTETTAEITHIVTETIIIETTISSGTSLAASSEITSTTENILIATSDNTTTTLQEAPQTGDNGCFYIIVLLGIEAVLLIYSYYKKKNQTE